MKRSDKIAMQASNPKGILGKIIGFIMSFETKGINQVAISLLNLKSNDKVLEVGFGHGKTIRDACKTTENVTFSGIDISETMLSVAKKNNKKLIKNGIVELKLSGVESIPYQDNYFDKALSVHAIYFWKDLSRSFKELHRVLKPGAYLVIGFRFDSNAQNSFPENVYTFYSENEVASLLQASGFSIKQCKKDITNKRSLYWLVANKNA